MPDTIKGLLLLGVIALIVALLLWKWGNRVVFPHARIIRVWGAPKSVRNQPGFLLIPKLGKLIDTVYMPGDWQIIDLPFDSVITSDGVRATVEIDLQYRIRRIPDPKYKYGVMDPEAAVTFQASWRPETFERAVGQSVREAAELTVRKYRSTKLGSPRVMLDLSKAVEQTLKPYGDNFGAEFDAKIGQLEATAASDALEGLMSARVGATTRRERSKGLEDAIAAARKRYGYTPDGDAVVEALKQEYILQAVPRNVGVTTIGGGLLDALSGLVGSRVSEAERRARSKTRR